MSNFKKRHNRPPIDQFIMFPSGFHRKPYYYYYEHDNYSLICYFQNLDTKITSYKIKMPNIRGPVQDTNRHNTLLILNYMCPDILNTHIHPFCYR